MKFEFIVGNAYLCRNGSVSICDSIVGGLANMKNRGEYYWVERDDGKITGFVSTYEHDLDVMSMIQGVGVVPITIQVGKKYVCRNGKIVTCDRVDSNMGVAYMSTPNDDLCVWQDSGAVSRYAESGFDIVSEYTEPTPHVLNKQQLINKVIENFDFEIVMKTMRLLDLKWAYSGTEDQIPSIGELVVCAIDRLSEAYDYAIDNGRDGLSDSGGFRATSTVEDGEIYLELMFHVTTFNYCTDGKCY